MDFPQSQNPCWSQPQAFDHRSAHAQLEGPELGTLRTGEGGVIQHLSFPLTVQTCAPSGLCRRSESQPARVHSAQRQHSPGFPRGVGLFVHLPSVCLPSVTLMSSSLFSTGHILPFRLSGTRSHLLRPRGHANSLRHQGQGLPLPRILRMDLPPPSDSP